MTEDLSLHYNRTIEVLKRLLNDTVYEEDARNRFFDGTITEQDIDTILSTGVYDAHVKDGYTQPPRAETMIGIPRLSNFQWCIEDVIKNKIEGDIIETGVWRGGACILASGVLELMCSDKKIYVADSFEGLPKPDAKYRADRKDPHHKLTHLKVSLEEVKNNFKRYHLLTDRVQFIKGFFKDSLTNVPFKKLAVLRMDGDMYSSTWETLTALYDKLSIGGYIIVDDYSALPACKLAVDDFRIERNITEEIMRVDWSAVFWKKEK